MKQQYLLIAIIMLVSSCDCVQYTTGVVLDKHTKQPIGNVALGKYEKEDADNPFSSRREYTDSTGHFDYHGISGGLFGCPSLTLFFSKEGYRPASFKYECSGCVKIDTIYLEK